MLAQRWLVVTGPVILRATYWRIVFGERHLQMEQSRPDCGGGSDAVVALQRWVRMRTGLKNTSAINGDNLAEWISGERMKIINRIMDLLEKHINHQAITLKDLER